LSILIFLFLAPSLSGTSSQQVAGKVRLCRLGEVISGKKGGFLRERYTGRSPRRCFSVSRTGGA
jgi:hypothetical protein